MSFFIVNSVAGMPSQRQRSRKACQPCRQRKRKCNGRAPCDTCVRYDYDCYYGTVDRGVERPAVGKPQTLNIAPRKISTDSQQTSDVLDRYKIRHVGASSAVAFPKILGLEPGTNNALRFHSFAWNLGVRPEVTVEEDDLTQYLPLAELQRLTEAYFQVVHPVFDFIDRDVFEKICTLRYMRKCSQEAVDPIICGVAALGSLYTIGSKQSSHPHEVKFVEIAKSALEHTSTISSPTQNHITAWVLRTIYLRSTTRPHASWLSSCTTMHLIEAIGLHQEVSNIAVGSPAAPEVGATEVDMRRRLFWVAWSLNTILSYEYGRSRVDLSNISAEPIESTDRGTFADQYIALAALLPVEVTGLHDPENIRMLYESLAAINALPSDVHEIVLLKADLAFCLYRRLRQCQSSPAGVSCEASSLVIAIGLEALVSSSVLAQQHVPWWTVISVPFQLLCVLLSIDSRESLSHVAEAMIALEEVGRCWDTHMVREAVGSAGLLVKLSRKRKEEDLRCLEHGMSKTSGRNDYFGGMLTPQGSRSLDPSSSEECGSLGRTSESTSLSVTGVAKPPHLDWADGIDTPLPENYAINWDNFFHTLDSV